ncbi:hypothetical protein HMPREF3038_00093 [Akkermansia sp. KLE1797]|nr:hypothetical protein HMPREF3038_00093 [Akkermansia sp. KLE1797]KXU55748.1 hypothetical protein HMPREF3039_00101 [Akkermansia sp. KLE1798]KZA05300.1 hypothetical protein HMPREF1326_01060 [Akkermansia sp. KLE1605]
MFTGRVFFREIEKQRPESRAGPSWRHSERRLASYAALLA